MPNPDELMRELDVLKERMSTLSGAILRISGSLDTATVLREALDSARVLSGARYGAITTVDESGQVLDFLVSGVGPGEHEVLEAWPDGPKLFEHLRQHEGVLRLRDVAAYVRSLGISHELIPESTFLSTPMLYRDKQVGFCFVSEKEGGAEFGDEDETVLKLFASQAASAIVNARIHEAERRARADLEALIESSPVGVVVFDPSNRWPIRVNGEARRIVGGLKDPDESLEQKMDDMTCRFADGREVTLDELSLAQQLSAAETVRTEEVVLSVPDGRSVTMLINATPIQAESGEIVSVVVTMQDLEPLRDLDRMRAEFLGMVSHELRTPLTSIVGSAATVLGATRPLDSAEMIQFFRIIEQQADQMRALITDLLDAGRIEAGMLSVAPQPATVAGLVDQARSNFITGGGRQTVAFDLPPDLPRVFADPQRIVQIIGNLLSNAARHSPETSLIRVAAVREDSSVLISVSDEGRGVAPDQLGRLFNRYADPDRDERSIDGHGLGLAICRGLVEAHGGRIQAESPGLGQGTRIAFTLPVAEHFGEASAPVPQPLATRSDSPRVLVVDDDPQTLRLVRDALSSGGFVPVMTGDPAKVPELLRIEQPDLVLLDLMFPGIDGIELMASIPELTDRPVVFISGYGRDETIARALEQGAVDYIVKPFSPTELNARVRAALRRRAEIVPFVLDELAIRYDKREVTVAGLPVALTATEYELLRVLSVNAGKVVTYGALLRQVWAGRKNRNEEVVRTFIKRLRQQLGERASRPRWIFNERGVGYRMPTPPDLPK